MKDCNTPKVLEIKCPGSVVLLHQVDIPAELGDETTNPPKIGDYRNVLLVYEATGATFFYSSDGTFVRIASMEELQRLITAERDARIAADNDLQGQIDDIRENTDVVDIVGSYAALQAYDTSKLNNNDIVKVLVDETHDDASTYYRWHKTTSTWEYIGEQPAAVAATHVYLKKVSSRYETYTDENLTVAISANDLYAAAKEGQVVFHYLNGTYEYVYVVGDANKQTLTSMTPTQYRINFDTLGYFDSTLTPSSTKFASYPYNSDGTGNSFTVTTKELQEELTAGNGITISGNTISAAAATTYYADYNALGSTFSLYEDEYLMITVDSDDVAEATEKGLVVIHFVDGHNPGLYDAPKEIAVVTALMPGGAFPYSVDNYTMLFESLINNKRYKYNASINQHSWVLSSSAPFRYTAGTNVSISSSGQISATDTTYSAFTGATSGADGAAGLVPKPLIADKDKFLKGDGTWETVQTNALVIRSWS